MVDKTLYQQIVDEITTGQLDKALWAMVWAKSDGDENKAKARYVQARVTEIRVEQRRLRRIATAPQRKRLFRSWIALFVCALISAVVIKAIVRNSQDNISPPRWDFYFIEIAAYTLGLLLFPGLAILLTWGSKIGFNIAFATLVAVSVFACYGSLPDNPRNRVPDPVLEGRQGGALLLPPAAATPRATISGSEIAPTLPSNSVPSQNIASFPSQTSDAPASKETVFAFVKNFLSTRSLSDVKTEISYFEVPVQIGISPRLNKTSASSADMRRRIDNERHAGPYDYILKEPVITYPIEIDGTWRVSFKAKRVKLVPPYSSANQEYEMILAPQRDGHSLPFKITAIEETEAP